MKITRFDDIEFQILNCANMGMYSHKDEYKERALLLMKEKILKVNPLENWWKTGWKFTKTGEKYYSEFLSKMRKRHGHVWETNRDSDSDLYSEGEYGDKINIFAYSVGFHNGPRCKNCGYYFCQHCDSEFDVPACLSRKS
jgi:hypothetical protein